MSFRNTTRCLILVLCLVLGRMTWLPALGQTYQVTNLGSLGGGSSQSQAFAISSVGQIVGVSNNAAGINHPFLWAPAIPNGTNGAMQDLGTLSDPFTDYINQAVGINDGGQVVGSSMSFNFKTFALHTGAFLWSGGVLQDLGALPGFTDAGAVGINRAGQIVGSCSRSAPAGQSRRRGFLFSGGQMTDLGTLGGLNSSAIAINDAGQILGMANDAAGISTPFLYCNGAMHSLGSTGGVPGSVQAINNSGQVAGTLSLSVPVGNGYPGDVSVIHAYLWIPSTPNGLTGTFQDLGTAGKFGRLEGTEALAVNASGVVVGIAGDFQFRMTQHAFIYRNGVLSDLNDLIPGNSGWVLNAATGINDAGEITGYGTYNGLRLGFLLTPSSGPTIPAAPIGLAATAGNAQVALTWRASVGAASYHVKRGTRNTGPFQTLATVSTTSYVDLSAHNGVKYYYTVSAVNSAGESPNSLLAAASPR
jgi:probable HAF family extracellular repeat protein